MRKFILSMVLLCTMMVVHGSEAVKKAAIAKKTVTLDAISTQFVVQINENITVTHVKEFLKRKKGFPVRLQMLDLLYEVPALGGWVSRENLDNNAHVSQLLDLYKTARLVVRLNRSPEGKEE